MEEHAVSSHSDNSCRLHSLPFYIISGVCDCLYNSGIIDFLRIILHIDNTVFCTCLTGANTFHALQCLIYTLFTVLAHHTFNLKCFFHKLTPIITVIIAYFYQNFLFFTLHTICVMVPIGQYTHHVRGLYTSMVRMPSIVLVSIRL